MGGIRSVKIFTEDLDGIQGYIWAIEDYSWEANEEWWEGQVNFKAHRVIIYKLQQLLHVHVFSVYYSLCLNVHMELKIMDLVQLIILCLTTLQLREIVKFYHLKQE